MKNVLVVVSILAMSQGVQATTTDDLRFSCTGIVKIVSVGEPYYNPPVPPHGRFDGYPASAGFKAKVKVTQVDQGCSKLSSKYQVNLEQNDYEVSFSLSNPTNLSQAVVQANSAVGMSVGFETKQYFSYVGNTGHLPLFPDVHGEEISMISKLLKLNFGVASFATNIPIYIPNVYHIGDVEHKTDKQKLALAKKMMYLLTALGDSYSIGDFGNLFLKLEPQSDLYKNDYGNLLWLLFENIKQANIYTQFFDFDVGGQGSFVGKPFGKKLVELMNAGVFTHDEMLNFLVEFPPFLIMDRFDTSICLKQSSQDIENVLKEIVLNLPHMNLADIHLLNNPIKAIYAYPQSSCIDGLVTPTGKELAGKILKALDN